MAIKELFEISRSSTFLSRLASAASWDTALVGLNAASGKGEPMGCGDASDVSMEGSSVDGLAIREVLIGVISCVSGELTRVSSRAVLEHRRDSALPLCMEDRLEDFRCTRVLLGLRGVSTTDGGACISANDAVDLGVGRVPNI